MQPRELRNDIRIRAIVDVIHGGLGKPIMDYPDTKWTTMNFELVSIPIQTKLPVVLKDEINAIIVNTASLHVPKVVPN